MLVAKLRPGGPPKRLPERKRMTLIAGFVCPDGFVIAADTEVSLGFVRIQEPKLLGSDAIGRDNRYRLVLGGAGTGPYIDEAMQEIKEKVSALKTQTRTAVD